MTPPRPPSAHKTADNERIKLRATYYNNIAAGLYLGGVCIPYLALVPRSVEFQQWIDAVLAGSATVSKIEMQRIMVVVLAFILAWSGARIFRNSADREISKITD
jgi:hypothetical protein